MTVLITLGLPGSGKTTEARRWQAAGLLGDHVRTYLDRDSLREMIWGEGGLLPAQKEMVVSVAQQALLREFLRNKFDVAVADTNLREDRRNLLVAIAHQEGHAVLFVDLRYVPIEVCIERDELRHQAGGRYVGGDVIRKMAAQYGLPVPVGQGLPPGSTVESSLGVFNSTDGKDF